MLIAGFDAAVLLADKFEALLRISNSVISCRVNTGRCELDGGLGRRRKEIASEGNHLVGG